MAVYTTLDHSDIEVFLQPFGLGPLLDFSGVAGGIENTNYFLTTDESRSPSETSTRPTREFVLTLFEEIGQQELAFIVKLTTLLNNKGSPVPAPLRDADGQAIHMIAGKPAVIVPKLPGQHPKQASPEQCAAIGAALGTIHAHTLASDLFYESSRGLHWLQGTSRRLASRLDNEEDKRLLAEVDRFISLTEAQSELPVAIIHSDLFRDNALFVEDQLSAIIDFNNAGSGYLMYDLAVLVNDWCSKPDGSLDSTLTEAILTAYQQARPITPSEKSLWNDFLRIAAARFWISRLVIRQPAATGNSQDPAPAPPKELAQSKNPDEYRQILLQRIQLPHEIS